jgi:hypothetical protein
MKLRITRTASIISTLVDHGRDKQFVVAFCPICDHAEEAPARDNDLETAKNSSIAIIRQHLRRKHRVIAPEEKLLPSLQAQADVCPHPSVVTHPIIPV